MGKSLVLNKITQLKSYIKNLSMNCLKGVEDIHTLRTKSREILSLIDIESKFYYDLKKVIKLSNEIRDIDVFFEHYITSLPNNLQLQLNLEVIFKIANNSREKKLTKLFLYLENINFPQDISLVNKNKESIIHQDIEKCLLSFNEVQLHKFRIYIKKLLYQEKNKIIKDKEKIKTLTKMKDHLGLINDNYNGLKRLKTFHIKKELFKQIKIYTKEESFKYYEETKKLNQLI